MRTVRPASSWSKFALGLGIAFTSCDLPQEKIIGHWEHKDTSSLVIRFEFLENGRFVRSITGDSSFLKISVTGKTFDDAGLRTIKYTGEYNLRGNELTTIDSAQSPWKYELEFIGDSLMRMTRINRFTENSSPQVLRRTIATFKGIIRP